MSNGLVLTGGGARGADQAGVLRAVGELHGRRPLPFQVISGTSAGSINGTYLAGRAEDFEEATAGLWALWESITLDKVYKTDTATMVKVGAGWIANLGLGGWMGSGHPQSLLDTAPLRALLTAALDVENARCNIASGVLHGLAVSTTRLDTGLGVTFYDANPEILPWVRRTRTSEQAHITLDHVMASAAIPIFFPATSIEGLWYSDGGVRMHSPLSPAIHLGAKHILAIGVQRTAGRPAVLPAPYPSTAHMVGLLLDALFMDALDADIERAERINRTLALLIPNTAATQSPLHPLTLLTFQPTRDLGRLGDHPLTQFPYVLRHLLRGLGATDEEGWSLLSYLAFEPSYIKQLLSAGYSDGMARKAEILAFLKAAELLVGCDAAH